MSNPQRSYEDRQVDVIVENNPAELQGASRDIIQCLTLRAALVSSSNASQVMESHQSYSLLQSAPYRYTFRTGGNPSLDTCRIWVEKSMQGGDIGTDSGDIDIKDLLAYPHTERKTCILSTGASCTVTIHTSVSPPRLPGLQMYTSTETDTLTQQSNIPSPLEGRYGAYMPQVITQPGLYFASPRSPARSLSPLPRTTMSYGASHSRLMAPPLTSIPTPLASSRATFSTYQPMGKRSPLAPGNPRMATYSGSSIAFNDTGVRIVPMSLAPTQGGIAQHITHAKTQEDLLTARVGGLDLASVPPAAHAPSISTDSSRSPFPTQVESGITGPEDRVADPVTQTIAPGVAVTQGVTQGVSVTQGVTQGVSVPPGVTQVVPVTQVGTQVASQIVTPSVLPVTETVPPALDVTVPMTSGQVTHLPSPLAQHVVSAMSHTVPRPLSVGSIMPSPLALLAPVPVVGVADVSAGASTETPREQDIVPQETAVVSQQESVTLQETLETPAAQADVTQEVTHPTQPASPSVTQQDTRLELEVTPAESEMSELEILQVANEKTSEAVTDGTRPQPNQHTDTQQQTDTQHHPVTEAVCATPDHPVEEGTSSSVSSGPSDVESESVSEDEDDDTQHEDSTQEDSTQEEDTHDEVAHADTRDYVTHSTPEGHPMGSLSMIGHNIIIVSRDTRVIQSPYNSVCLTVNSIEAPQLEEAYSYRILHQDCSDALIPGIVETPYEVNLTLCGTSVIKVLLEVDHVTKAQAILDVPKMLIDGVAQCSGKLELISIDADAEPMVTMTVELSLREAEVDAPQITFVKSHSLPVYNTCVLATCSLQEINDEASDITDQTINLSAPYKVGIGLNGAVSSRVLLDSTTRLNLGLCLSLEGLKERVLTFEVDKVVSSRKSLEKQRVGLAHYNVDEAVSRGSRSMTVRLPILDSNKNPVSDLSLLIEVHLDDQVMDDDETLRDVLVKSALMRSVTMSNQRSSPTLDSAVRAMRSVIDEIPVAKAKKTMATVIKEVPGARHKKAMAEVVKEVPVAQTKKKMVPVLHDIAKHPFRKSMSCVVEELHHNRIKRVMQPVIQEVPLQPIKKAYKKLCNEIPDAVEKRIKKSMTVPGGTASGADYTHTISHTVTTASEGEHLVEATEEAVALTSSARSTIESSRRVSPPTRSTQLVSADKETSSNTIKVKSTSKSSGGSTRHVSKVVKQTSVEDLASTVTKALSEDPLCANTDPQVVAKVLSILQKSLSSPCVDQPSVKKSTRTTTTVKAAKTTKVAASTSSISK